MPPYGRRSLPQMQKHQSSSWRPFSESCFAVLLLAWSRCQCQRFNLIWDKKGQIGQKLNLEINLWWAASSHCQPLINCDLSTILAPYGEQPLPPLSCTQAHQTSPCQEQPAKFRFQNDKISAKGILFYLAIRSQPDADVEDLVVVEEGEGEGAVHSSMSAVSHQKAPILSNCKTDRRWKVAWKWDQILPKIPCLTNSSAAFLSTGLYQGSPDTWQKRKHIERISNVQI